MFLRLRRRRPPEAARPSPSGSGAPRDDDWLPLEPAATTPPGVPLGDLDTPQPDSNRGKAIESKRGSHR